MSKDEFLYCLDAWPWELRTNVWKAPGSGHCNNTSKFVDTQNLALILGHYKSSYESEKKYQFYIVKKVFPASIKIYTMHKYHYYSECFQSLKWVEWVWRNQRPRLQPQWQSMWSGREGPWMWSLFCGLLHSTVSRPKVLKSGWWTNGVCMNIFPADILWPNIIYFKFFA